MFLRSTSEAGKDRVFGQYHSSSGYIFGKAQNTLEVMENDYLWVASLPTGPKWHSMTLKMIRYLTIQPINLIWRDGLEVVQDLFANPIFANHVTYDPHVVVDGGECKYSEYFMAQQAFEIQDQLPEGATIILMIVASDKTLVTQHMGGLEMCPILVTVGNIQSDVRMRATCHAWQCIAYMPIPKFVDVHPDYQTILSQHLFHKCMNIVFADAKVAAMENFLHTCHKFFFDHPFKWCKESVGKDKLKLHFRSHYKRVGTCHFLSGVCQMKQMTGQEHWDLQCTLVPSITGAQSPVYSGTSFHDHKHAILDAGVRRGTKGTLDNFIIPKLELLQSFAMFTKDTGALIQWTADVTERLLITDCKLPFKRTSCQSHTFTEQIIDILNCKESMRRFQLYLFLWMHDSPLVTESDPALADLNQWCFVGPCPSILSSTATAAFHITMSLNEIQQLYALPDFGQALPDYIMKASTSQFTTAWSNDYGCLKTWNKTVSSINCDAVIMQSIQSNQTVNHIAQVQAVFQPIAPCHITLPYYLADQPLLYVQYYEIIGDPGSQPAISMYMVAQKYREGPTGQWIRLGAVIPLTDITHAVELLPMYS
ncbi:uncharacterized protein F5147DRAFT_747441 [Suillus discolor]|uniref:Uncharacterized protein n=1 Tax=Suillus discolor TaxID=1912936 RepID=A0A9P7JQ46_9AGAM|nr:uncharacterized protein F5147DRAFT_747441 [Suillus discolor]KAG2097743.1 hypothetical protein F5147DRAFT_747441 [Suillus discolor]